MLETELQFEFLLKKEPKERYFCQNVSKSRYHDLISLRIDIKLCTSVHMKAYRVSINFQLISLNNIQRFPIAL